MQPALQRTVASSTSRTGGSLIFTGATLALVTSLLAASAQPNIVRAWEENFTAVFVPAGLTNVASIAASHGQSLALNRDGSVVAWGDPLPGRDQALAGLTDVAAISMGWNHGLALRSNGTVVAWGEGPFGENVVPDGLSNVTAIAAGGHYNLALKNDGTVVAWGQPGIWLNVPGDLSSVVAIAASTVYNPEQHNLALKGDGTLVAWGGNFFGQSTVPSGLSNVVAVAAGYYHNLALKSDGTVAAWGNLAEGGQVPTGLSNVVAIAAGAYHNLALKSDGTVTSWKGNLFVDGAEHVPANLSNVTAIAAGERHSLALSLDPSPYFRIHPQGQRVGESEEDGFGFYTEVRGAPPLSYQWRKDGVDISGATNSSLWVTPSSPTNAGSYALVASNSFGTATSQPAVITVEAFLGIFEQPQSQNVYVGEDVTFSLHLKGTAPFHYQWRKNSNDIAGATGAMLTFTNVQLSDAGLYDVVVTNIAGSVTSHLARLTINPDVAPAIIKQPQSIPVWPGAKAGFRVAATGAPMLLYQWRKNGANISSATTTSLLFESVGDDAGVYDVVVSNTHGAVTSAVASLTITERAAVTFPPPGTVANLTGAMLPDGLTNIVAVSAGRSHALALRSDGTVAAWGSGLAHFLGADSVPVGLSNVIAVSAGGETSLALRDDGTVASWGRPPGQAFPEIYGGVAVFAGRYGGAAVLHDGRVVAWEDVSPINGLSNVTTLAADFFGAVVVHSDGTVRAYGLLGPVFPPSNTISNGVSVAIGTNLVALTSDGTVVDLQSAPLPSGLTNVTAISGSLLRNLALKSNGTVQGWGNIVVPEGLSNVTAIAAGNLYTLVVMTNPPPPSLAGSMGSGKQLLLSSPFAVSGYVLEATADLSQPYMPVGVYTNTFDLDEANNPALMVPISGERKFYRFRKL